MEENNVIVWNNKTYIQEQRFDSEGRNYLYGSPIYFDVNIDTSKSSTVEVSDSPIDARNGSTLSDKRIVNMKTIGISGKYSSRNTNNSSFKVVENRLGIIIDYFEDALNKQRIYTVCRKGSIYSNMMLNKVNLKFDEHCSTVTIALSFIEVIIIGVDTELQSKVISSGELTANIIESANISEEDPSTEILDFTVPGTHIKQISPRIVDYVFNASLYNTEDYHLSGNKLSLYVAIANDNVIFEAVASKNQPLSLGYQNLSILNGRVVTSYKTTEDETEQYIVGIVGSGTGYETINTKKQQAVTRYISLDWLVKTRKIKEIISMQILLWYESDTVIIDENAIRVRSSYTREYLANPSNYEIYLDESKKTILTIL